MEDILNAFYCSLVLHNMAVRERIDSDEEVMENDAFYDCVADMEPTETILREPRLNPALQFTNMQENHVMERALEVEYLSALGINVVDATLALDLDRISVIPQYQRVAQYRWSQLYNSSSHLKLTKAIARELKTKYDEFKIV
jgi:hypothetical protein